MAKNDYELKDCKVKATLVDGSDIIFDYVKMRHDAIDDIYWYKDKSLSNIEILDPQENPQTKFNIFE
jgi:hypothetical protein